MRKRKRWHWGGDYVRIGALAAGWGGPFMVARFRHGGAVVFSLYRRSAQVTRTEGPRVFARSREW